MSEQSLRDRRILVVEDEYLLADELCSELRRSAALVVGMAGTVEDALRLAAEQEIDAAILDVNLGGEAVFPVADRLLERGVPFIFTTGYDSSQFPARFQNIPRCQKPLPTARAVLALQELIFGSHAAQPAPASLADR